MDHGEDDSGEFMGENCAKFGRNRSKSGFLVISLSLDFRQTLSISKDETSRTSKVVNTAS